eukprot:c24319_g1_i1 orf=272-1222(-)
MTVFVIGDLFLALFGEMGTPEFPDLGQHCSVQDCKLVDFLPFKCDCCLQVFCLEHRSYIKHQCSNANINDVSVLVCPLCAKTFRLIPDENPNNTWEEHVRTDCNPQNYEKVSKKPRCPVPGCREQLTFSNKVVCRDCKQEVCLKHRFGQDHQCKAQAKAQNRDARFTENLMKRFKEKTFIGAGQTTGNSGPLSTETVRSGLQSAASSIRASAEIGMTKFSTLTSNMLNVVTGRGREQRAELVEVCPQCEARFATVALLIGHVEDFHCSDQSRFKQDSVDVCPKCGMTFRDAISLVSHVERDHGGTSADPVGQNAQS